MTTHTPDPAMDDLTDAQIEAMADKCPGITRHSYILGAKDARAAIAADRAKGGEAIPSAQPAPEGWKLVPMEPTEEMLRRILRAFMRLHQGMAPDSPWEDVLRATYREAIAAAPAATQVATAQAEPALYVSGPYHDGSMSVCELATGRILHKFRLDGPSAPVGDGDLLLQAIQKLNQNPYSLTKGECIAVLEELRATQPGKVLIPIAPDARKGQAPCGECHLSAGETCDICGAKESVTQPEGQEAQDAARYRWLRARNTFDGDAIFTAMRCTDPAGGFSHNVMLMDKSLDEAIDAARSAQAGGGK